MTRALPALERGATTAERLLERLRSTGDVDAVAKLAVVATAARAEATLRRLQSPVELPNTSTARVHVTLDTGIAAGAGVPSPMPISWRHRAAAHRIVGLPTPAWNVLLARLGEQDGLSAIARKHRMEVPLLDVAEFWLKNERRFMADVRNALCYGIATDAQLRRLLGMPCVGGPSVLDAASAIADIRGVRQLHASLLVEVAESST